MGPLRDAALREQQRDLIAVARAAAQYSSLATASPAAIASMTVAGTDLRVTIVGKDGSVLADSHNDPSAMGNHLTRPEIAAALGGNTGSDERTSATEGIPELYAAVPATLTGTPVAFRVSRTVKEIASVAEASRNLGLWLLAGAVVIAVIIATWASAAAAQPIQALSTAAQRMASGNLAAEVPSVPTDLQALAEALASLKSQMRGRLDALEYEQQTLRTALDGLSDAVFLLDAGVVRFANDAAGRLFKLSAAGWRDIALERVGLPESLSSLIASHIGCGEVFSADVETDPRGTTYRLLVIPLGSDAIPRTLAVVSDATERARLDAVRRDFVANASHELKTPVAGIQLLAESTSAAASDGDIEQALAFARQIDEEAARLKRLVADLLDLSRLESAPTAGAIADVRTAIDNAIAGHRGAAGRRGLALDADLSAIRGQDVYVAADLTDVAIALDNLVDNAIAYTEAGSVQIAARCSADTVDIEVRDTGSGIAPEHLARVFERFYRVDRARSRDGGGTGLGLSLVRHVVERNGGSVTISSEAGVGTSVHVRLPRAR